jgi:formylglycine-generating enzyme required for sulfatase activity
MASIADPKECPQYGGLQISEQLGLVPVGRDPNSGLWEFAHFQTGEIPNRGAEGALEVTEETALVLVLLPGGTFQMGAAKEGQENLDPLAESREGPVNAVTLDPFFLSKYEMNQGQWQRFTKENPSYYSPERTSVKGVTFTLKHPVERVSWHMCMRELPRMGLTLPTEAQWEYAARAGTSTPWWTGKEKESLGEKGAANIADKTFKDRTRYAWAVDWLDDGYIVHAPADELRANPFGLHHVYGNVWEWCRDAYDAAAYKFPARSGDGERIVEDRGLRLDRGGSYSNTEKKARSAHRQERTPGTNDVDCGVRPARALTKKS